MRLVAVCAAVLLQIASAQAQSQRNLILFVPDGLRALSVTPETAPAMAAVHVERFVERSKPGLSGLETILVGQRVGQTRYFDAAGFPGRTVGMEEPPSCKPLIAEILPGGKCFSIRCLSVNVFVLHDQRSGAPGASLSSPYSTSAWSPILGKRFVTI
jgi:hypothetical protein